MIVCLWFPSLCVAAFKIEYKLIYAVPVCTTESLLLVATILIVNYVLFVRKNGSYVSEIVRLRSFAGVNVRCENHLTTIDKNIMIVNNLFNGNKFIGGTSTNLDYEVASVLLQLRQGASVLVYDTIAGSWKLEDE